MSANTQISRFKNIDLSSALSKPQSGLVDQKQKKYRKTRRHSFDVFQDQMHKTAKNREKNKTTKRYRRYFNKLCPKWTMCCCFCTIIGILLFLAGIAALLVFLLTNKYVVTTATSTTSTSKCT